MSAPSVAAAPTEGAVLERLAELEATLGSQLQRIEHLVLGNSARLSCLERAVEGLARAKENGSQSAPGGYGGGR